MDDKERTKPLPLARQLEYVAEAGLNFREYKEWNLHWRNKVRTSKYRGIACSLTFRQYLRLAVRAGLTRASHIGDRKGKYVLARNKDVGPYSFKNCSFIKLEENSRDLHTNGRVDYSSVRDVRVGKTKEDTEFIARQAATMTGRRKSTHIGLAIVADKNSRDFTVQSPSGVAYTGRNLKEFCLEHGLNQSHMSRVCRGVIAAYKGWTGAYDD